MSATTHKPPTRQAKLAAALKRNMARRKEVGSRQSSVVHEANSQPMTEPCVAEGEPGSGRGQQGVGDKVPFNHEELS